MVYCLSKLRNKRDVTVRHAQTYPSCEREQCITQEKVIDVKRFGFSFNVVRSSCASAIISIGLLATSSVLGWAAVCDW